MDPEDTQSQADAEYQQFLAEYQAIDRSYIKEFDMAEMWGLEVVKTLFLINAAGLTGTFALASNEHHRVTAIMFAWFAVGIALSVLSMTLGRYMHDKAADGWLRALDILQKTKKAPSENPFRSRALFLQFASHLSGYSSAVCAVCGGFSLYGSF